MNVSVITAIVVMTIYLGMISGQRLAPELESARSQGLRRRCLANRDHIACKEYYKKGCIDADGPACQEYSGELKADCGSVPSSGASGQQIATYLSCMRSVQCWQDRSIAIQASEKDCKDNLKSEQCILSKARLAQLSKRVCDDLAQDNGAQTSTSTAESPDSVPVPTKKLTPPARAVFDLHIDEYHTMKLHKAFAVSDGGWRGWSANQVSELAAEQVALRYCRGFAAKNPQDRCWVVMVDEKKLGIW